tara:strand:- start:11 stop:331 length:321 start_codon:yes stop_codon:yes gene_type:complete
LATIKLTWGARSKVLLVNGEVLSRDITLDVPAQDALRYLGDSCLDISFAESDRKELKQIEPARLTRLSRALGEDFDTHDKLCAYLLPAKAKVKKAPAKSKKSSLTE